MRPRALPVARGAAPLPRTFYERPAAAVARGLLGAILVCDPPQGPPRAVRLVETEAYVRGDPASHAFRGRTPRNRSMFGPAGHLYVFPIHQVVCANAVARQGEAVLLRAGEPLGDWGANCSGPGRLCRALGITRGDDGSDLLDSRVRIYPGGGAVEPVRVGPRVGLRLAADRPLRFLLAGNPHVSGPRRSRVGPDAQ